MNAPIAPPSMWMGSDHLEAQALFRRLIEAGLTAARAFAVAQIGSFSSGNGWVFRKAMAKHGSCSVRTVQRGLTQAADLGIIGKARAKKNEIPPGADGPIACRFSNRWVIGRGKAGRALKECIERQRLARTARKAVEASRKGERMARPPIRPEYQNRTFTAAEIEAELAKELPDAISSAARRRQDADQIVSKLEALPPSGRGFLISRLAAELARDRTEGLHMLEAIQATNTFVTDELVRELERRLAIEAPPLRGRRAEEELQRLIAKYGGRPPPE